MWVGTLCPTVLVLRVTGGRIVIAWNVVYGGVSCGVPMWLSFAELGVLQDPLIHVLIPNRGSIQSCSAIQANSTPPNRRASFMGLFLEVGV